MPAPPDKDPVILSLSKGPHPPFPSEAYRSAARLADIGLGLSRDTDSRYWREHAAMRIVALEDESDSYGLYPYEETELAALRALIAR